MKWAFPVWPKDIHVNVRNACLEDEALGVEKMRAALEAFVRSPTRCHVAALAAVGVSAVALVGHAIPWKT